MQLGNGVTCANPALKSVCYAVAVDIPLMLSPVGFVFILLSN